MKKKILFLCTHNSSRSQIAEGLMRHYFGNDFEVFSAGSAPTRVNPFAVLVMKEIGIDITNQFSKDVKDYANINFDYIVTVCDNAKESCPFLPGGSKYIHKSFQDPSIVEGSDEAKLEVFRKVRDEIKNWIQNELKNKYL